MWELRLVWFSGKPAWWDETWKKGVESLARQQRKPEPRPDLYLVVPDRVDVGLKLRGGAEGDFDAKVLHARSVGWELWEKIAYFQVGLARSRPFCRNGSSARLIGWRGPRCDADARGERGSENSRNEEHRSQSREDADSSRRR